MRSILFFCFSILACLLHSEELVAQSNRPILEREISLKVSDTELTTVLKLISKQADFTFSYANDVFDGSRKVNISVSNKTVREVLNQLFNSKIIYKTKGVYLILLPAPKENLTDKSKQYYFINGYIIDKISGNKISSVSIYDGKSMVSTLTNQYGFFSIKLDDPSVQLNLKVSKQNYQDTLVAIRSVRNQTLSIAIRPLENRDSTLNSDSSSEREFTMADFLIPEMSSTNSLNIIDTLYHPYQVSLIPTIGTNKHLSGNVINDYSFNILGGYSMGTRKAELAGLFNIDRGDVSNFQLAGLMNAVGGDVNGAQISGIFNLVKGKVHGLQLSGYGNVVWDTVTAVQISGGFNFNRRITKGVQVAGFLNFNLDSTRGVQGAGFLNVAMKNISGTQIAGFLNISFKDIHGVQVAGFCNYAKTINGSQISFFNYSDSCTGIPVGFLSYVNKGYHQIELSGDELFYANLGFRSGVRRFYNILFAGIRPEESNPPLWTFGYGIGSAVKLGKKALLDLDLSAQQVIQGDKFEDYNLICKFTPAIEYRISKYSLFTTGPVVNANVYNSSYSGYPDLFGSLKPHIFYSTVFSNDTAVQMWFGWKLGLRFS